MNISEEVIEKLRVCQKESIKTVSTYLSSRSKKACLISLPTGAGKSGVICVTSHSSKSKRVLVLTHRRAVCDQLVKQLKGEFYKKILDDVADIPNLKSVFKNINSFQKEGIYCTTVQMITALSESELDSIKDKIDLVIFDEGHAEPASKWSKAVRKFKCKKLIITATPYRNDLFSFDIDVKHHYIYTFKNAVENHDIVDPNFEVVNKDRLIERIKEIKISQPESVCIVKCKELSDVEHYLELLKTEFNAVAIHDSYAKSDNKNKLQNVPANIHEKDYEVIIHQRKLDEGVDLPQAKILILTYPVASGRELVQTVGRVVRTYKQYQPYIIGLDNNNNLDLWSNFKIFDEYLSNEKTAKKFIRTLDTAILIETYVDEFPEHSYYNSGFKKKFDFKGFNPVESLEIPLASVCFYKKNPEFDLADCLDKLYWEFNRQGALSKYDSEFGVVTSVTFNNSKFLKDSLFFEPSLEIMVVKELGQEYIAVFDSQNRKFSDNKELEIGSAVDMDTLFKVISHPDKTTLAKQANTRALQTSNYRPEGISYIGNLETINHPATNSTYAITTGKFNNVNNLNQKIDDSYYLGVGSGRISDQKNRKFNYQEFIDWLDDIYDRFQSSYALQSDFVSSFAKPADSIPLEEPSACILDFSNLGKISFKYNNFTYLIDNDYIFTEYNSGFSFIEIVNTNFTSKYDVILQDFSKIVFKPCIDRNKANGLKVKFLFDIKSNLSVDVSDELSFYKEGVLLKPDDILNKETVKLLYNSGVTFLKGQFFESRMPTESGKLNRNLMSKIIPLDCLLEDKLSEKDERNTTANDFGVDSIFHQIDKLSNIKYKTPSLASLGNFYQYLPNVDLVLCTDMGTEPADFILSSKDKLIMVHVKCGDAKNSPKSGVNAIAEVGSQAIKNIHALVGQKFERYSNDTWLRKKWKVSNINSNKVELDNRIRLFNGFYDLNIFQKPDTLKEVFEEIDKRRKDVLVRKEMWIIIGNGFSASHFRLQMENISTAAGESKQAYQLIDTWLTQLSNYEVDLKIFVSH